jgi:RNA polymerase sigma-70 factor (ECF subfamily)
MIHHSFWRIAEPKSNIHCAESVMIAKPGEEWPELAEASDQSLLLDFRAGDLEAATQLYERYARRLGALAQKRIPAILSRQLDPDDIVQSVFRSFFRSVRAGAFVVPEGSDLWPLLLVIALNKIRAHGVFHTAAKRDIRRTQAIQSASIAAAVEALHSASPEPFLRAIANDLIEALPPRLREVVQLRLEGYQVDQIANRISRTKRSVERLLHECRERLDAMLDEESLND